MQISRPGWNLNAIETHSINTFSVSFRQQIIRRINLLAASWMPPLPTSASSQQKHSWQPGRVAEAARGGSDAETAGHGGSVGLAVGRGWAQPSQALALALVQPWHPVPQPGAERQRKAQQPAAATAVGCGAGGMGCGYREKRISWGNLLSPLPYPPSHKLVWTFASCWKTIKGKSWHIFHPQETPGWPWDTTACFSTPDGGKTLGIAVLHHWCKVSQTPKAGVQGDWGRGPPPVGVIMCRDTEPIMLCFPLCLFQWERRATQLCLLPPLNQDVCQEDPFVGPWMYWT